MNWERREGGPGRVLGVADPSRARGAPDRGDRRSALVRIQRRSLMAVPTPRRFLAPRRKMRISEKNRRVAGAGLKKSPVERGLEFPSLVQLYAAGGYPALGSDFRI